MSLEPPMRRVVDALLDGQPPDAADQAALAPDEIVEVQALARTAALARATLHAPDPPPLAEARSLQRAQSAITARPALSSARPSSDDPPRRGSLWDAWRQRRNKGGPDR